MPHHLDRGARRASLWLWLVLLNSGTALASGQNLLFPVEYPDGYPRVCASFVEDHHYANSPGNWHAGLDIPECCGADSVRAASSAALYEVVTISGYNPPYVLGTAVASVTGAHKLCVSSLANTYMCDVLRVDLNPAGASQELTVQSIGEAPPGSGLTDGIISLDPSGPSLTASDVVAVTYFYYKEAIAQVTMLAQGPEYQVYAHIDDVHDFIGWRQYPATPTNRFYELQSVPSSFGRVAFSLNAGDHFARILTLTGYGSEPPHLHFGTSGTPLFGTSATNPLGMFRFNTDDPWNVAPTVRSLSFQNNSSGTIFSSPQVYGAVDIFAECRDVMGSPEQSDDGDGSENSYRDAGVYNAGYWITSVSGSAGVATASAPNMLFPGPGKLSLSTGLLIGDVLRPGQPFEVDQNTNYHLWVSHTGESDGRFWNTVAVAGGSHNDGSDAPAYALTNAQARFPDGKYSVHAIARDVIHQSAARDSIVVVDNFRPFVLSVAIAGGSQEIYKAAWRLDGASFKLAPADPVDGMRDSAGDLRGTDGLEDVVVTVTFSESMKDASIASIEPLGFAPALTALPGQDSVWVGTIPRSKLTAPGVQPGPQLITIDGHDHAGNQIRETSGPASFPASDNARDLLTGAMLGTAGVDAIHRFSIGAPIAFIVDDSGSMWAKIEEIMDSLLALMDGLDQGGNYVTQYTLVRFSGDDWGTALELIYPRVTVETADRLEDARTMISAIVAQGGGHCLEPGVTALEALAAQLEGPGECYLFTDADVYQGPYAIDLCTLLLEQASITVNSFVSGVCDSDYDATHGNDSPGIWPQNARMRLGKPGARARGASEEFAPRRPSIGGMLVGQTDGVLNGPTSSEVAYGRIALGTGGMYVRIRGAGTANAVAFAAEARRAGGLLLERSLEVSGAPAETPFSVDGSVASLFVSTATRADSMPAVSLRRPSGAIVSDSDPGVTHFSLGPTDLIRIDQPEAGTWRTAIQSIGSPQVRCVAVTRYGLRVTEGYYYLQGVLTNFVATCTVPMASGQPWHLVDAAGAVIDSISFFDDGSHADGSPGDGVYGGSGVITHPGPLRLVATTAGPSGVISRESWNALSVARPSVRMDARARHFGSVPLGAWLETELEVHNVGFSSLTLSASTAGDSVLTLEPYASSIPAGGTRLVRARFLPTQPGAYASLLQILTNDPGSETLSVSLSGTGVAAPRLPALPDSIIVEAAPETSVEQTLRLRSTGSGTLSYFAFQTAEPGSLTTAGSAESSAPGGSTTSVPPVYRWESSGQPGGPEPRWTDISGYGTKLRLMDETISAPIALPWGFTFCGESITEVTCSSNGYLLLGAVPQESVWETVCLPSALAPAGLIAGYWADLDPSDSGNVYVHVNDERAVFQFDHVEAYGYGLPNTFQIVLFPGGAISLNYLDVDPATSPVVGIQNSSRADGLTIFCPGSAGPPDNSAVLIHADNPWLRLLNPARLVAAGDSTDVILQFSASNTVVAPGTVQRGSLVVATNDPISPRRQIPITFTVGGSSGVAESKQVTSPSGILQPVYPNPVKSTCAIRFALEKAAVVRLDVCDVTGRQVGRILDETLAPGSYSFDWDPRHGSGQPISGGVYFLRLKSGSTVSTQKLIVIP